MAINSHLSPKYTNSAPPEQTNQPTDQSRSRRRNISRNLFPDGDLPETELIGGLAGRVKSLGDVESLPAAKRQKINKPKSENTPPYLNEKKFEASSSDSPFPISFPALLTSPAVFSSQPPSVSLAPGAGTRYPQPLPPTPPRPSSSVSAYSILYNEAMQGTFTVNESSVNLTLLGNGTFMKVFSIASSAQLVDNLSNTELILKLYHGERTKFIPKKLDRYLENSLANYKAVQELNVPVSKIHNYDAAVEKRDKFLLVENIPHPINIDDEKHIAAARDILEKSFRHKVLVDLAFSNLRTKADGTVTLVDFVEKPFAFEKTRKLGMFVLQFLKSWCAEIQKTHEANSPTENRSLAANLLDELTKNLQNLGFQPEWNEEALRHAFPVTIRIAG